jgi:hypothetical protein
MASNALWGHIGSCVAAVLAGLVAYFMYPDIKFCFLVIGASALSAVVFVQFLPEGDRLMGRGFQGKQALDEFGHVEQLQDQESDKIAEEGHQKSDATTNETPEASTYWEVISDKRCFLLCLTGFFFQ